MIRRAVPADAAAITEVHFGGWRTAYRGIMPDDVIDNLDDEARRARWHDNLANGSRLQVAEAGDRIIGFAGGGPSRDEDRKGWGEVYALYVDKDHWGTGVAAPLLAAEIEDLRAQGFERLHLWVLSENARARRFYERQGWVFDGTEKPSPWVATEARYELPSEG